MSQAPAVPPPPAATSNPGTAPAGGADVAAFAAGGLAAALGIAIAEVMAGVIATAPSLVIAIGDLVIENQPPGAKELIVELFGSNNKLALNVGIIIAAIIIAGLLGVAGRRSWSVPLVGFVLAGAVGLFASLTRPLIDPLLAVITVAISITVALAALRLMLRATGPVWATGVRATAIRPSTAAGTEAAPKLPPVGPRRCLTGTVVASCRSAAGWP